MAVNGHAPLSEKLVLPAEMQDAMGEYRKGISLLKKELADLDRQANEQLKARGNIDRALDAERSAMRGAVGSMERRLEEQNQKKADAAKETMWQKRLGVAKGYATRIKSLAGLPSHWGGAINAVTGVEGVATAMNIAHQVASAATNPIAATLLAYRAASSVYEAGTEGIAAEGKAAQERSNLFFHLTGGDNNGNVSETGSAARALRVQQNLANSFRAGIRQTARGPMDIIANYMGYNTSEQVDYGRKLQEHEAKLEEARQRYGLSYNPLANAQTFLRAKHEMDIKTSITKDFVSAAGFWAKGTMYTLYGPENMTRFADQEWNKEIMESEEKTLAGMAAGRKSREWKWNAGAAGALRRVLENEKRRWLRAVETDRVSRFNDWAMK
jgi:hypothetical protein